MKKCILIISLLCLILTGCYSDLYDPTPEGYIDKAEHFDELGWLDSTDYAKYRYNSDGEKLFKNNGDFLKVKNDDIKVLGEFYDNFKNLMSMEDRENEFDMKKACITDGDYYRIENWWYGNTDKDRGSYRLVKTEDSKAVEYSLSYYYNLYYYDTENSTLYYLHNDT